MIASDSDRAWIDAGCPTVLDLAPPPVRVTMELDWDDERPAAPPSRPWWSWRRLWPRAGESRS